MGVPLHLGGGGHALHGKHHPTWTNQGKTPRGKSVQWCDGTRSHHVRSFPPPPNLGVLGAAPLDLYGEFQVGEHHLQPLDPTAEWLHEDDVEIRSNKSQRYPGQARAGADIENSGSGRYEIGDDRAVQDVTLPDPRRLTWPDEAPLDAGGGEMLGVTPGGR